MRIRKRSGPLGFSSNSTIALSHSDPPLISTRKHEEEEEEKKRLNPSFGDEHHTSDQVYQTSKTSSDLELTFIRGKNGWVCCSDDGDDHNRGGLVVEEDEKKDECMMNTNPTHKMEDKNKELIKGLKEEEEDGKMMMMIRSSTTTATKNRRSNSLGGEEEVMTNFGSGVPPFSSNTSSSNDPHQGVLKGFPMKKRRGSNCERKVLGDDQEITRTATTTEMMIKQKKIMKTTNKKWVLHEKDRQETFKKKKDRQETDSTTSSAKKNEEGSRCSRINGRGWRCCQQALVGYSLCEHHSCKGRLRSMNSTVRNRSSTTATTTDVAKPIKNLELTQVSLMEKCHEDEEDDDDYEEKTSTTMMRIENKKRKKTGMVKARSISSLLGQTQVHDDYVKV